MTKGKTLLLHDICPGLCNKGTRDVYVHYCQHCKYYKKQKKNKKKS